VFVGYQKLRVGDFANDEIAPSAHEYAGGNRENTIRQRTGMPRVGSPGAWKAVQYCKSGEITK
jgi:hypothetical protein